MPAATSISGTAFTLTLPKDVIPKTTNDTVDTGVVSLSGTFSGSTLSPQVIYTAAAASTPGTLRIILASSDGVTTVGEVATINLRLSNDAAPTSSSFVVGDDSIIDAAIYAPITGMNVVVASVTLQ